MAEPRDERTPTCPYCGCARHDSERLHDGNAMETADLVDAMMNAFLRNPGDTRPAGIWPLGFPADYTVEQVTHFRAKMEAALGVSIRNMPYLAALRSPGLDRDGERMRERCAKLCEERADYFDRATGYREWKDAARSYRATASEIRALAHEEKAGC